MPDSTVVLSRLPNNRLYQCDLFTGDVKVGKAVSGELRDVVFDGARCVDRRALAPGTRPALVGDEVLALCGVGGSVASRRPRTVRDDVRVQKQRQDHIHRMARRSGGGTGQTATPWTRSLRLGCSAWPRLGRLRAIIWVFEAKYHYTFWRPVRGITRADTDDDGATTADPAWRALLTVNCLSHCHR